MGRMDAYAACTTGAGLVDRTDTTGRLALTGGQARELLDGQVTNDVDELAPGEGRYAAFLTPKGKMLGDLRVLARPGGELLLLCERVALQPLFDLLRRGAVGWDAELHKRTLQMAQLSLVGPRSAEVAGVELPEAEHGHVEHRGGVAVRTDVGVDLVVPIDERDVLVGELAGAGAVRADEATAEVVRVEHGRPRFGVDLDGTVIPQEAGLNDRAVSFTKGCYVGQETVARLFYKGKPNRHLRGLAAQAPLAPGAPLTAGEREVGRVGTAVVSPARGPLGLALVRREVEPGTTVDAGGVPATVVELPF
jgi:folate-binding protein YgfZ